MERDEAIRVYSVNRQLAEENRELAEENRRLALSVAKLAEDRERLEREIEDWKDKLDASEITHEATRADLRDCKRELEQQRQDRKQADLDTIRALGERNDARKALAQERQLADRLAKWLENALECDREGDPIPAADIPPCREALADWANSRNEPARFWVPGESCPDCGNDLSVRDHGDGRVYDGDECRCCECAFTGYLSVDEDGQTLVNEYQADEAVNPP